MPDVQQVMDFYHKSSGMECGSVEIDWYGLSFAMLKAYQVTSWIS